LSKKTLDKLLTAGEPEAAGVVQGAIEDFAHEFARVIRRFLKLKAWRDSLVAASAPVAWANS
jgi:hypothetical protein